jgi:hypothetical protein
VRQIDIDIDRQIDGKRRDGYLSCRNGSKIEGVGTLQRFRHRIEAALALCEVQPAQVYLMQSDQRSDKVTRGMQRERERKEQWLRTRR